MSPGLCRLGQGVVGWEHICVSEGRVGASGNVAGGREPSCVYVYVYVCMLVCVCVCDIVSGCVCTCMCDIVYVCVYLCVHVCDIVSGVQFVCLGVRLCMSALFVWVCVRVCV